MVFIKLIPMIPELDSEEIQREKLQNLISINTHQCLFDMTLIIDGYKNLNYH